MKLSQINNPYTTYTSPKGREFRTISIEKVIDSDKWIGRVLKYKWRVLIKYLDNNCFLYLNFDYNDQLTSTTKYKF